MLKKANKPWTAEDDERLRQLANQGASLMRATGAMRRSTAAVRRRATELGLAFASPIQRRAQLRASGVLNGVA